MSAKRRSHPILAVVITLLVVVVVAGATVIWLSATRPAYHDDTATLAKNYHLKDVHKVSSDVLRRFVRRATIAAKTLDSQVALSYLGDQGVAGKSLPVVPGVVTVTSRRPTSKAGETTITFSATPPPGKPEQAQSTVIHMSGGPKARVVSVCDATRCVAGAKAGETVNGLYVGVWEIYANSVAWTAKEQDWLAIFDNPDRAVLGSRVDPGGHVVCAVVQYDERAVPHALCLRDDGALVSPPLSLYVWQMVSAH